MVPSLYFHAFSVHVSSLDKHNNNYKTAHSSQEVCCLIVGWYIMFTIPSLFTCILTVIFYVPKNPPRTDIAMPTPRKQPAPQKPYSHPLCHHFSVLAAVYFLP
jgi:hypothetical protein